MLSANSSVFDGKAAARAAAAWAMSAIVLLIIASAIINASNCGEYIMGYVCSALSFLSRSRRSRERQKGDFVYRRADGSGHYDRPAYSGLYREGLGNRGVGGAQRRQLHICREHSRGGNLRERECVKAQTLCAASPCLT